ncbi:MAG TPA: CvpA family protein [Bacilli bacterium]
MNQLVSIAGLVISYILAYQFFDIIAPWIRKMLPINSLTSYNKFKFLIENLNLDTYFYNALAFTLIFVCVKIALVIAGHLLNIAAKIPGLSFMNKWCGALLACVEVLLIVVLAVHLMNAAPSDKIQKWLADSRAAAVILTYSPLITNKLQALWNSEEIRMKKSIREIISYDEKPSDGNEGFPA